MTEQTIKQEIDELATIISNTFRECFNSMTNEQVWNAVFNFEHLQE
jgi:hypothetical protein